MNSGILRESEYVTFDTNLQDFDAKNRNQRYYDNQNTLECILAKRYSDFGGELISLKKKRHHIDYPICLIPRGQAYKYYNIDLLDSLVNRYMRLVILNKHNLEKVVSGDEISRYSNCRLTRRRDEFGEDARRSIRNAFKGDKRFRKIRLSHNSR